MFKTFTQYIEQRAIREMELPKDIDAARDKPGGSNVGKERKTSGPREGESCGPSGGAPAGSYPISNPGQIRSAKGYAHNAPNPSGIKACADRVAAKHGWD